VQDQIDNFETHIVPIIADIDAGFGNEEATYLLTKKMIEAGACAIQIENQVSDANNVDIKMERLLYLMKILLIN
jgi:isocitrate lyase